MLYHIFKRSLSAASGTWLATEEHLDVETKYFISVCGPLVVTDDSPAVSCARGAAVCSVKMNAETVSGCFSCAYISSQSLCKQNHRYSSAVSCARSAAVCLVKMNADTVSGTGREASVFGHSSFAYISSLSLYKQPIDTLPPCLVREAEHGS